MGSNTSKAGFSKAKVADRTTYWLFLAILVVTSAT
jgi:hypothetical protein